TTRARCRACATYPVCRCGSAATSPPGSCGIRRVCPCWKTPRRRPSWTAPRAPEHALRPGGAEALHIIGPRIDRGSGTLPIYEYRCTNGHNFEVMQSMSDDPVAKCQVCGAPVERVFHPVAVHFKGSGFYSTDYGRNRGGGASTDSGSKEESKTEAQPKAAGSKSESSSSKDD